MAQILFSAPSEDQQKLRKIVDIQRQTSRARRIVTPGLAFQAASIAAAYPNMDSGQVVGLAIGGEQPGSPTAEMVSERQLLQTQTSEVNKPSEDEGWFDNFVYDPFKGLIRGAFTVLNGGIEELESLGVRTPIGMYQGEQNALGAAGRSDAFHALSAAFSGEAVNLGEGFFPNSTITEDVQEQLAQGVSLADAMAGSMEQQKLGTPVTEEGMMDRERLKITSRAGTAVPISFGRAAAINFTEPGTRGFQYLSGFADAFKQVALDPADLVLGGAGKARKLSKLVGNADSANILSKTARGVLLGDSRKSFFQTGWNDYLTSEQGSHFVQRINDATGEEGMREIYDLYRGTQKAVEPDDMRKLADSTNYEETARLVQDLGEKQGNQFRKFGRVGFGAMQSGTAVPRVLPRALTAPLRNAPATALAGTFGVAEGLAQTVGGLGASALGMKPSNLTKAWQGMDIPMRALLSDAYETGLGFSIRQGSTGTYLGRIAASTGSKAVNVNDQVQAFETLNQYFRGLGLNDADYNRLMYKASDPMKVWDEALETGEQTPDMFTVYFGILKEANEIWADGVRTSGGNVSEQALEGIGNMFNSHDEMRAYWKNNAGDDMLFGNSRVTYLSNGEAKAMPSALMFSQFMDQNIPLMDPRAVRSLQRRAWWADKAKGERIKKLFGADDFEKIGNNSLVSAADFGMSKLWKPAVLLRMAWPVRVIGEEQFRLSGNLLSGAFNHPIQFISLMMAKDNKFLGKMSRMSDDALGNAFLDAAKHDEAMSKSLAGMTGGNKSSRWQARTKGELGQRGAAEAHINAVNQMLNDEVTVEVARRLQTELTETGSVSRGALRDIKDRWWDGDLEYMRRNMVGDSKRFEIMNDKYAADAYIDDLYAHLVHQSGGKGRMLNPLDNAWYDFDGQVTAAADMPDSRLMEQVTTTKPTSEALATGSDAVQMLVDGTPAHEVASGIADRLARLTDNVSPVEDADDILIQLEDKLNKILSHDMATITPSSTEKGVDAIVEEAATKLGFTEESMSMQRVGRQQTGQKELIPQQEVLKGNPQLTPGAYNEVNAGLRDSAGNIKQTQEMPEGVLPLKGERVKERLPQGQVDELSNIGRGENKTFTILHPEGNYTLTYGEGGVAVAALTWRRVDGELYVDMMHASDNQGFLALMDDVASQGDISKAELLDAYVGQERFLDWFMENGNFSSTGVPDNITTYDELHKFIKENPGVTRGIEDKFDESAAQMSRSGAGMKRQMGQPARTSAGGRTTPEGAMHEIGRTSPQHDEYFKLEEIGDPRMIELIATGEVVGDGFKWGDNVVGSGTRKQFNQRADYFDDGAWFDTMPEYLRSPMENASPEKVAVWDRAVGTLMDTLMSKPTNKLSRSPAFRQMYWQRMSEMFNSADDEVRDLLRVNANNAGLGDSIMNQLGKPFRALRRASGREVAVDEVLRRFNAKARPGKADIIWKGGSNPDVALKEMDEIAKAYALEETKQLLYDMSNDHNWSDMARFIAPFGEAWYEVMSTWGKLIAENPRNIRRLQQAYQGAEGSNPFAGVGADGEQGQGFFYRDPVSGEEVFNYPGSGVIANWMLGDAAEAVSLKGRVSGLSLATQVLPGIGPAVQIPVSHMGWVDDPNNRMMRDLLLPFGKSKVEAKDPSSWLSPIMPPWVNKAVASYFGEETYGENKRMFMNTSMDVYKTLIMNGWSDSTEEEMQKTLAEAGRISKKLTFIKALSSFAAPTSASELWQVKYDHQDDDGELWAYQNMATAYRQILDQLNGDDVAAYKKFTDMFGVDPMIFTTAKTQRVEPRAVTLEARKWEYDNKDLYNIDAYPGTAYYARPDSIDGEFDYEAYLLALKDGTRQPLTTEQWAMRRNQMLGRVAYANFQRSADRRFQDTNVRQQWLRQQQASLMAYFPGFGRAIPGLPATHDLNSQIQELYRWEQDDRLGQSSVGTTLRTYLDTRDNVVRRTMAINGYKTDTGWRTGKNAVVYRAQLRALGQKLSKENPDFVPIYTQILLRELQEPEAGQASVELAGVSF
jgi:hypothetical protein